MILLFSDKVQINLAKIMRNGKKGRNKKNVYYAEYNEFLLFKETVFEIGKRKH